MVDRIDFSNDIATASPKGPLSVNRYFAGATGNSTHGYFAGGGSGSSITGSTDSVDRVEYSNDTATASPKGSLSSPRTGIYAAGNSSFGYFSGGWSSWPLQIHQQ